MSNIGDTHNPAFPTIAYAITIGHSTLDTLHSFAHFIGQLTVKTCENKNTTMVGTAGGPRSWPTGHGKLLMHFWRVFHQLKSPAAAANWMLPVTWLSLPFFKANIISIMMPLHSARRPRHTHCHPAGSPVPFPCGIPAAVGRQPPSVFHMHIYTNRSGPLLHTTCGHVKQVGTLRLSYILFGTIFKGYRDGKLILIFRKPKI